MTGQRTTHALPDGDPTAAELLMAVRSGDVALVRRLLSENPALATARFVHAGMRQLDAPAPHFTERVEEAQSIVRDRSQSPELIDADRELLANSLRSLRRAVVDRGADEQLLHGEPHAGNLLRTTSGMRFIDLETCCYGPVEFDIAHAPDEVGDHYALADPLLLRDCRILMLAMVAAWRADRDDDFPNGRAERDALLNQIRAALERPGLGAIP